MKKIFPCAKESAIELTNAPTVSTIVLDIACVRV